MPRLYSLATLQMICIKSTNVTVHTLNFPRMQTGLCISLLHFFIFKTDVPLFAFERSSRAKRRVAPAGMQSAVALSGSRASEFLHNMCFKSTSVTVQTLNFPRMQTGLCLSLLHFFIFKTDVPLFHFCVKRKMKKRT